jgi:ribosomal protein L40E
MNPLVIYIGMLVFALVAYLIARAYHKPVTRQCHRCGARVTLGTRRCKRCGYVAE